MRVRTLGTDGPAVTAVGCGDVSLARAAARGIDAIDVSRVLHEAIEAGIELVDVAEDAEPLVGEAVRALRVRDRVVVATRAPLRGLRQRVEASLRATRLEVLPLVQLPVRAADVAASWWPELLGACARLVREGKVLRWGAVMDEIVEVDGFCAIAVPFNVCERPAIEDRGIAVLARRPLAGGALAGTLGPGAVLLRTDDRREMDFERVAVGVAKLAALVKRQPPAARSSDAARQQLAQNVRPADIRCETVAELALRFVIDRGAIALPRLHRREHIAEAIAAAAAPPLHIEVPDLDS
jgi:aryl-alcohol dehydrogenase-like predicted oxidoreductase